MTGWQLLSYTYLAIGVFVWWAVNYRREQTDGNTFARSFVDETIRWPMWKAMLVYYLIVFLIGILSWPLWFHQLMRAESTDDYRARHCLD